MAVPIKLSEELGANDQSLTIDYSAILSSEFADAVGQQFLEEAFGNVSMLGIDNILLVRLNREQGVHRQLQAGSGTVVTAKYRIVCGDHCNSVHAQLNQLTSNAAVGVAAATAIINAVDAAATELGYSDGVISTPEGLAASVTQPSLVSINIHPNGPPSTPVYQCSSRLSCAELGGLFQGAWRNPGSRGDSMVCGESDHGFSSTADETSDLCWGGQVAGGDDTPTDGWEHAKLICQAIGARLCTTSELQNDETRGSGCQHDHEWIWASEACVSGEGHLVAAGASSSTPPGCQAAGSCGVRCFADSTPHGVRCCADVDPTLAHATCDPTPEPHPGCSSLSCAELGELYGGSWGNPGMGSAEVCAESNNGLLNSGGGNQCNGGSAAGGEDIAHDGWEHAAAICTSIGSRLCTVEELQNDETRGTGCQHDREWVWSSEPCDSNVVSSYLVAAGASNQTPEGCDTAGACGTQCRAAVDTDAAVRCCADMAGPICGTIDPDAVTSGSTIHVTPEFADALHPTAFDDCFLTPEEIATSDAAMAFA
eukprot:SAG31_NODE_3758_length_3911_cov_5.814533_1_plen_538_part_10